MKVLKKILKGLGIFILLLIILSFFLPSKTHLERSLVINAPAEVIFGQVNNLKNWGQWSAWHKKDPNMQITFTDASEGVGASYTWKGNNDVGEGTLSISASVPNDSIQTTMQFGGMGKSYGSFKFNKEDAGTKVIWAMDSKGEDMPWYMRVPSKYFSLFMDKLVGPDFEKGLADLKTVSEKKAMETPPAGQTEMKIEATTTPSQIIASYRMMTSEKTISGDIGNSYGRIGMFMKKNNLKQNGAVLAIYHSYAPAKIDMECAVPLEKSIKGEGEIKVSELKAGNAVVGHYYGAYEKTNTAHEALHKWMDENHKKTTGSPWEVYVTDPMNEKDTAKWLTEIYYPVE